MMNSVSLIGNLGRDAELRYTPEGTPVANFSIAVNEFYTDKAGEKQKRTHWFRIVASSMNSLRWPQVYLLPGAILLPPKPTF